MVTFSPVFRWSREASQSVARYQGCADLLYECLGFSSNKIQSQALSVLLGLCRLPGHARTFAGSLVKLGIVDKILELIKESKPAMRSECLCVLLYACRASTEFLQEAYHKGIIALLNDLNGQGELSTDGKRVLSYLMAEFTGLLHMMTTGDAAHQEQAAVAIWHLSKHQPALRASFT